MKKVLIAIALNGFTVFGIANIAHADLAQDRQQVTQVIHQETKKYFKKIPYPPVRITQMAFSGPYAAVEWEKGESVETTTLHRTDKGG
ncbi:MAG: hypothetical protein HC940_12285 [Acaryochloris sp. SU_5_25]|nr:hypothetical protein [Acaryochloris sp. SU_5_25]